MGKRARKNEKSQAKLTDLVVVTYIDDLARAREVETLLKTNDIPVVVREYADPSLGDKTVAVMVPEDYLDEAHVVIDSQDSYDDLYDLADEGDEPTDFDDTLFDEDDV